MPVTRKQLHEADRAKAREVLSKPHDEPCFICSCSMDDEAPPCCVSGCYHVTCTICIREWGNQSNRCPFCRSRFPYVFYMSDGDVKEIKFKNRNNVDYDYDVESVPEVAFTCTICNGSDNIASMVMCSSRDCSYTVHGRCATLQGIGVGDESAFKCPTHRDDSVINAIATPSFPDAPTRAREAPLPIKRAPSRPQRSQSLPTAPVDPFATRVVKRPSFLQVQQQAHSADRPYYLDMVDTQDSREGLEELKRRRVEVATVRARKEAAAQSLSTRVMVSRMTDSQLYDRVYRTALSLHEQRRREQTSAPEFDSFGNVVSRRSDRRLMEDRAAEQKAKAMADLSARAAVRSRMDAEKGADVIRETRDVFLRQQREAVALEKLRALIALKRTQM